MSKGITNGHQHILTTRWLRLLVLILVETNLCIKVAANSTDDNKHRLVILPVPEYQPDSEVQESSIDLGKVSQASDEALPEVTFDHSQPIHLEKNKEDTELLRYVEVQAAKMGNIDQKQDQNISTSHEGDFIWGEEDAGSGEVWGFPFHGSFSGSSAIHSSDGNQTVTTVPSFIVSPWGACSSSCGLGVRTRHVVCKVYLEFSQVVHTLPDYECQGSKPVAREECMMTQCGDELINFNANLHDTYVWHFAGYGECSASCLGGVQVPIYICIRSSERALSAVDSVLCAEAALPRRGTRLCNDIPCPPRWQVSSVGACSLPCGGGEQEVILECTQQLGHRLDAVVTLPDSSCPRPSPARRRPCNIQHCQPLWVVKHWSQCSVSCGDGMQTREVHCEQMMSQQRLLIHEDGEPCAMVRPKPQHTRTCNLGPCPVKEEKQVLSVIKADETTYVQLQPEDMVQLNVGGTAVLFQGVSVNVKCPVKKKFNSKNVIWKVGDNIVKRKGRVKVSKSGLLRIRHSDVSVQGKYTCMAGNETCSIDIIVQTDQEALEKVKQRATILENNYNFIELFKGHVDRQGRRRKHNDLHTLHFLLGQFDLFDIPFHFMPSEWSACSKSCGGDGLQSRDISCEVVLGDFYLVVPHHYCEQVGEIPPIETRDCGLDRCPKWKVGEWSQCSDGFCIRDGVGARKRPLYCEYPNNTVVPHSMCDQQQKPIHKEECQMGKCKATWKTSNWTQCMPKCGGEGYKTRSLTCVWVSNKQPGGASCRGQLRPPVIKPCLTKPCHMETCIDRSKYCSLVGILNMCRYEQYREQCCHTCAQPPDKYHNQKRLLYRI